MSVVLYGVEYSPPCMAVLVTAKSMGLTVELKELDLSKGEQLTESYRKINPAHSIPTLEDKDLRIWESRAILCYLVQEYGKNDNLYPKDTRKRAQVDNMLYFDATSLYANIARYVYPRILQNKPLDPEVEAVVKDKLSILDVILAKESFVAGGSQPSLADISIRCSLFTPAAMGYSYELYPNVLKWIARFEAAMPLFKEYTTPRYEIMRGFIQSRIAAQTADA